MVRRNSTGAEESERLRWVGRAQIVTVEGGKKREMWTLNISLLP